MAADIAKIKRNIQKMIDQGAPDTDIDGYLADEGVSLDMLKAPAEGTDEPSFFQRLLDVQNAKTGESYLYGNNPKPTGFGDVTRIMQDTGTRGFTDKITDGGAMTDAARERTPGYVEAPADITAAVASSPYRVASMGAGALFGGLEGAANAYGHQEGWMPEWSNIAKETGKGAALGFGGAKAGEWVGKGLNWLKGKPAISTADELYTAGDKVQKRVDKGSNVSAKNRDILARMKRMEAAELAQAGGKGAFKKMEEGMDAPLTEAEKVFGADKSRIQWPREERQIIASLANKPNTKAKLLSGLGSVVSGGNFFGSIPFAKATSGAAPAIGAGLKTAAALVDDVDPKDVAKLKEAILDNTGRRITDKKTVDKMRDLLAKTAIQQKSRVPPR